MSVFWKKFLYYPKVGVGQAFKDSNVPESESFFTGSYSYELNSVSNLTEYESGSYEYFLIAFSIKGYYLDLF